MPVRVAVLAVLALAAVGAVACGGSSDPASRLAITVTRPPQGTDRLEVECPPAGAAMSGAAEPFDVEEPVVTLPSGDRICSMLRFNPVMLAPPPMTGTCAGSYGIPPEIIVRGTYEGRTIDFSVRPCDQPDARQRSAILWLRALGLA